MQVGTDSFAVYLIDRIVQELDAIWAETMVSGSLLGSLLGLNACNDAKHICEPTLLMLLPCSADLWNRILGVSCSTVRGCRG